MIEDVTDRDEVHLPAEAFVGGVDADGAAVAGGAGVEVDAVGGADRGSVLQPGKGDEEAGGAVVEGDVLVAFQGVGVEQEPLATGQHGRFCLIWRRLTRRRAARVQ